VKEIAEKIFLALKGRQKNADPSRVGEHLCVRLFPGAALRLPRAITFRAFSASTRRAPAAGNAENLAST